VGIIATDLNVAEAVDLAAQKARQVIDWSFTER
jgi:hypothetical protein